MVGAALARLRRFSVWRFWAEVLRRFNEDQSAVLAGYIAYSSMLAGLPFMIFALSLLGHVMTPEQTSEAVDTLFRATPEHVALTLEPVLRDAIDRPHGGVLTVAALVTLYAASNGVGAIRIGFDRAYDIDRPRNFLINRLIQIAFVLIAFVVFSLLAVLIIFAPLAFSLIETMTTYRVPAAADLARYLVGGALLYGLLWLMHLILPALPMHRKRLRPGIIVSMLVWVLLASAASVFVAWAPSYTVTYGTLSGVIVTLLFFYLTGVALILGAQVNAVVNFGVPDAPEAARPPQS